MCSVIRKSLGGPHRGQKGQEMKLKYVEDLLAEAEAVTPREIQRVADMQVPTIPPKGDILGILPESLQKLAVVMMRCGEKLQEFTIAESSKPRTNDAVFELKRLTDFAAKAGFMEQRLEGIRSFFWEAVSAEFEAKEDGLAINRNWEVFFVNPKCKGCGKRHPKDGESQAKDPGLDELFGALSRNPGAFFGRGGNA